jgi:predicted esterase
MLQPESPAAGALVAMSVFKPNDLPEMKNGAGRRFYILHSPDDQVCPYHMAVAARDQLRAAGAKVEFTEYGGGHGWQSDVFGNIRHGIEWLERTAKDSQ